MRPEHVEPVRVVADDRRVIERLRVERVGAALEQELCELVRALVRRLHALAEPDHAGEHLERIVPTVVPGRVRVGAAIEQRARDLDRRLSAAGPTQVGEVEQRRPVERPARARCGGWIRPEPALDLFEVPGGYRAVEIERRDFGVLLEEPRHDGLIGSFEDRTAQHLVRGLANLALARLERVEQRAPAGQAVLARERELHRAQRDLLFVVARERAAQARKCCSVAGLERLQPLLRFFLEGFETGTRTDRAGHDTFLPICARGPLKLWAGRKSNADYRTGVWVGGFPCRGQEAPQRALSASVRDRRGACQTSARRTRRGQAGGLTASESECPRAPRGAGTSRRPSRG